MEIKQKLKIALIAIITIILVIGFVFANAATTEMKLSDLNSTTEYYDRKCYYVSYTNMKNSNNIYCVQKGQKFAGKPNLMYVVSKVVINGNKAQFYTFDNMMTTETLQGQCEGEYNNLLGAIICEDEMKLGYGSGPSNNADSQIALWYYWNEWVALSGADKYGIEAYSGNTAVVNSYGADKVNEIMNKYKEYAENNEYNATVYCMKECYGAIQNILLVERGESIELPRELPVEKVWGDSDNKYNTRPNSITVKLLANDVDTGKTITLDASNNWKGKFENLDKKDENGNVIQYTVKEVNSGAYKATITGSASSGYGFKITNTLITIDIPVKKAWDDDDNRDGLRPQTVQLTLYADGVEQQTVTVSGTTWSYTFEDLPKYNNQGKEINYTIKEKDVSGYTPIVSGDVNTGLTVTNTHVPEKTNLKIVKVWDDMDDLDDLRPTSIKVKIKTNNGEIVKEVVLDENNQWTAEITDLYKYENQGQEITYTVEEEIVTYYEEPQYTKTIDEEGNIIYKLTNKHEPHYDGYIEITGKVWLDGAAGKGNDINGTFGEEDSVLEGINVRLKYIDGNGNHRLFDEAHASLYETKTNSDGEYIIRVNYDNSQKVYKLYESIEIVEEKLKTAYVEFEYDGMKYTTVKTSNAGENTSKAVENEETRNAFDANHSNVTSSTTHPDKWQDKNITATTITLDDYMKVEENVETSKRAEVIKYCNGNGTYTRTCWDGAWKDVEIKTHTCKDCNGTGHMMRDFEVEVKTIKYVNLGLFEREQPDVAIFSDLSKVQVTMNGQRYTYIYNVRSNENNNVGLQVKFQNKGTYTYRRPVNPADIAYIQEEANKDAMSVLVTYEVKAANLSTTLPIIVHNITNYYDKNYTLNTPGWTTNLDGTQFNEATYNGDLNIELQPQTESSAIELTYTVSLDAIRGLLNEEATLNNAVEIEAYSTKYGEDTLYAEQRTGGRTNQPYGGYDYDSHPGNAGIFINTEGRLEAQKPEDDTDIAPSFVLCKDEDDEGNDRPKVLSGTVWEDTDLDNGSGPENFRLGDGKKADNEKTVANAKVELYKVDDGGNVTPAYLYNADPTKDPVLAVAYSVDGYYAFGNADSGYGVVTDRYLIKFTYGDGIERESTIISSTIEGVNVNARNYKSTIISSETELYNLFKETSNNEEWHLNIGKGYSIAVDEIEKRLEVEDLQYSNFNNTINMIAYSKPFKMQVEFDSSAEKSTQVGADGKTTFGTELNVFDFGIIERAREDIFVEKDVNFVKITLANGQELTQGYIGEGEIDYVKVMGPIKDIQNSSDARNAIQKQLLIEMDQELIQGAQLEIKYAIKVTNHSEKEYDYYVGDQIKKEYYYFGTNTENSPLITSSVNYLVDYVDSEIEYTWETSGWSLVTADELSVVGQELINPKAVQELKSGKYIAYATEQFSELAPGEESEVHYATARKLLANSEELVYENHLEILKIDAKSARTIKGKDENNIPVLKEYKPGNYVPSRMERYIDDNINSDEPGRHEQDDDNYNVIITTPTGETNYIITYVLTGLVGLIVMVAGVIVIKKKVLIK